jgi:methylenetetrahydrofolate reductase (NADPH)
MAAQPRGDRVEQAKDPTAARRAARARRARWRAAAARAGLPHRVGQNGRMKLRDIYARPGKTFSVEFYPPKDEAGVERLFAEMPEFKKLDPAFCSVTYGAGGSTQGTTLEIVRRMRHEAGLESMCHLTVVNQPKSNVHGVLQFLRDNEIENLIALAGDPPRGTAEGDWAPHPEGYHHSRELVEYALTFQEGWFSVAVAGFPEVHPRAVDRESDLRYCKAKVDAGADAVITQMFFENDDYYRYAEDLRALGVEVPIVPGMMPIQSPAQCRRMAAMCQSKIPAALESRLEKVVDDPLAAVQLGIDYTTEQCQGLLEFGVPGFHFYTLNRAYSVAAIFDNLKLSTLAAAG